MVRYCCNAIWYSLIYTHDISGKITGEPVIKKQSLISKLEYSIIIYYNENNVHHAATS